MLGFLYFCKDDPRIIVPKRNKGFGWTLNFARPIAIPLVILVLGIAAAPVGSFFQDQYDTPIFFEKAACDLWCRVAVQSDFCTSLMTLL